MKKSTFTAGPEMRKGVAVIGMVVAILLIGTFVNWSYQWEESMRSKADHQCSDEKDKLLLVPGAVFDPKSYEDEPGEWKPFHRRVSCEELIGKKD